MGDNSLSFELRNDLFHIAPATQFYRELREIASATDARIRMRPPYDSTRSSEYFIDGKDASVLLLESLINLKRGERVDVMFDGSVQQKILDDFRNSIDPLFSD